MMLRIKIPCWLGIAQINLALLDEAKASVVAMLALGLSKNRRFHTASALRCGIVNCELSIVNCEL